MKSFRLIHCVKVPDKIHFLFFRTFWVARLPYQFSVLTPSSKDSCDPPEDSRTLRG